MASHPENIVLTMLIVFGSAKLLAELFEKIGQAGIIGEILAGALIGPAVLDLVRPDAVLTALADLGVMFLLFRVGLEVRPRDMMNVGRTALLVASLGVAIPFILGWGVMQLWGESRIESIFVGAALVATSVGITARILAARGLISLRAGHVILAAAVIDDVFGFMVLSVVSAVARGSVRIPELLLSGLMAVGFTVVVARWGSGAANRIFAGVRSRLRAGEAQFHLAMIMLFGLAVLAAYAGVAAIVGAFLAGMALSESLEKRVHTLSQGVTELLTPFFLVGIGLNLDLRALANSGAAVLTIVILLVAVLSKLTGCGIGALPLGRTDAIRVAAGMVPRGEVGLVVAQIGLRMNALSPAVYDAIVLVAVLTTLIAPLMLTAAFRGAGQKQTGVAEELSIE